MGLVFCNAGVAHRRDAPVSSSQIAVRHRGLRAVAESSLPTASIKKSHDNISAADEAVEAARAAHQDQGRRRQQHAGQRQR